MRYKFTTHIDERLRLRILRASQHVSVERWDHVVKRALLRECNIVEALHSVSGKAPTFKFMYEPINGRQLDMFDDQLELLDADNSEGC